MNDYVRTQIGVRKSAYSNQMIPFLPPAAMARSSESGATIIARAYMTVLTQGSGSPLVFPEVQEDKAKYTPASDQRKIRVIWP